jgi:hypothetical protein
LKNMAVSHHFDDIMDTLKINTNSTKDKHRNIAAWYQPPPSRHRVGVKSWLLMQRSGQWKPCTPAPLLVRGHHQVDIELVSNPDCWCSGQWKPVPPPVPDELTWGPGWISVRVLGDQFFLPSVDRLTRGGGVQGLHWPLHEWCEKPGEIPRYKKIALWVYPTKEQNNKRKEVYQMEYEPKTIGLWNRVSYHNTTTSSKQLIGQVKRAI